tara:strand:+ start:1126 stop:1281 length:156 start_codon:yes stop_codon:yes gene_type:complete
MKSKGLGDTVAFITKYTGIRWIVRRVSKIFKKDCGCAARQETLNRAFPYKK